MNVNLQQYTKENDASPIILDILNGDLTANTILDNFDLNWQEIQDLLSIITNNSNISGLEKLDLIDNIWRLNYLKKPPTMEEFLTSKYIGAVSESLFPYVKKGLIEFWEPSKPYRDMILYLFIGAGKSLMSAISNIYVAMVLSYMRNAKKYFGLNPASVLTQVLISFTEEQAKTILSEPIMNILLSSNSIFERCLTLDSLHKKCREDKNMEKFYWTTASSTAMFTFNNGVNMTIASKLNKLLGRTIVTATFSELNFFEEQGFSQDYIMRIFNDAKTRIESRMVGNYFGRTFLDSSPNDKESKIEKYIIEEAPKRPENYIMKGAEWEYKTWKYKDIKKSFYVFKGNQTTTSHVIEDESVLDKYNEADIIKIPKHERVYQRFLDDCNKCLKDIAGIPMGADNNLIHNKTYINNMFYESLHNILGYLVAPEYEVPEGLLWNKIKDIFFIENKINNRYEFWRHAKAERFISVDHGVAEEGDTLGFAMSHKELDKDTGEDVYVVDMNIAIMAVKGRISLDSIKFLIHDLRRYGNINIQGVSFDQFQSEASKQYLKLHNFDVYNLSVDSEVGPYLSFVGLLNQGRVKAGRNVFLKNNLKSLIMSKLKSGKKKVDHKKGDVTKPGNSIDWKKSSYGLFAKDVSDATVGSVELCRRNGHAKGLIWDQELMSKPLNQINSSIVGDMLHKLKENMYLVVS